MTPSPTPPPPAPAAPVPPADTRPASITVRVGGKPFRCPCGCNVFHHPGGRTYVYECNACGTWFNGK